MEKLEYERMKNEDLIWAKNLIEAQNNDPRPFVKYRNHRPITDLKDMLEQSHTLFKDRPAFYTKFEKGPYSVITYDEFYNDINALGTKLIDLGLKDKRIGVIGETNYMWSVAYMAIICGCGIVVPIDKELPYDDLKNIVKEANCDCVIFDSKREASFVKMLEESDANLKVLIAQERKEKEGNVLSFYELIKEGKELIKNGNRSFLDAKINSREMAVILFTSGTTGLAKGIMLSHRNLCADIMQSPSLLLVKPTDIFFALLPIHHTFECTASFLEVIYKGASIAHCEGLKYIVKNMQEVHPTFLLAVPAIFEALHKQIWKGIEKQGKTKKVKTALKLSNSLLKVGIDMRKKLFKEILDNLGGNMRTMICGGAAINPQILDDFNAFGIVTVQGYGLSEASPIGAMNPDTRPKSNALGVSLPGFSIDIFEPNEEGIGEIILKGDNIMLGYYNREDLTNEVIRDGWFYTGDLGYIDDEGYVVLTGRRKNVIITKNGKNVFPEELEYQLSNYPEILESMVFEGDSDSKDDTLIVAAIYPDYSLYKDTSKEEIEKNMWQIIDEINKTNPGYKMIRKLVLRQTEFEKNTSKKIKRFVEDNKKEI